VEIFLGAQPDLDLATPLNKCRTTPLQIYHKTQRNQTLTKGAFFWRDYLRISGSCVWQLIVKVAELLYPSSCSGPQIWRARAAQGRENETDFYF
jgi:hypothetical protein